jgi:hypothetical protein
VARAGFKGTQHAHSARITRLPHARPWRHVVLEVSSKVTAGDVAKASVRYAIAPETSAQRNVKTEVFFTSLPGAVEQTPDSLETFTTSVKTSEGTQPLGFQKWQASPSDQSLRRGFICTVRYSADLCYVSEPQSDGPSKAEGFLGANRYADFNSRQVKDFLKGLNLTAELSATPDDLTIDARLIEGISHLPYRASLFRPASGTALSGGDCGSKSNLFEAVLRSLGIPSRILVGYLVRESGECEVHCRVERLYRGWWIPMEPTGYRAGGVRRHTWALTAMERATCLPCTSELGSTVTSGTAPASITSSMSIPCKSRLSLRTIRRGSGCR